MTARPPRRWDDPTCGVPDCPCPHKPYPNSCERGWVPAPTTATTPGARANGGGLVTTPAAPNPPADGGRTPMRCPVCQRHARSRAAARQEST